MSSILSHGLTVPTNPVQPQPAPTHSAPPVSSLNDAFAPTVSAMESYYNNKLYEQDADFMQNRAFDDDVPDPSYARRSLRTSGLIAYVTSDLSTARAKQARDTFGHTSPYRQDKHTGMLVGRALCATLGYPGDPVTFIRNHGKDTIGLVMPQTGYSTAQELYSLIGTTFATQQRNAYTKAIQAEQARATAAEETRQRVLPGAITRAVTGSSITPEEDAVLKSSGISETSLAKVRLLTGLKGLASVSPASGAQQNTANPLNNLSLLGIENNPALKSFSLFDREGLYKASRIIGKDQTARAIYLNLMLIAGRNQRDSHHSDNFLANFAASTANLIGDVSRAISETAIEPGMNAGFGLASLVYDDAGVTQYKALVAEAADAFEKGYKQRSAELNQEYGSSIGSRILWNLADFPTSIAEPVANTAPFMHLPTAVLAVAEKAVEEQQTAAANAKGDPNAGIMQLGIVPTARAAIFGASVYGTGWAAGKALGALSKTSIGRSVAARVAISPKVRYTANVTEGITTEAIEEFVDATGQEALELTGLVEERQKRENWSNFCKLMQDREFWTADVAMNLVFGAFGYKGSRSKSPYKDVLKDLGFTQKEQQRLELELVKAQMQGATNATLGDMVMESVRAKQAANPQLFKDRATAMVANAQQKQAIQEAAANGVLRHVVKKSGASNMQKNEDGTYNVQTVTHGEDGKFELKEERFTEQQLQDWLASDVNRTVTSEILYLQSLVRGEQVSRAAESAATTPFSRVVSMLNAPAELLTKLDGKTSFDEETLTLFSEYAINEINLRMAQGETAEQARAAEFGTTGATLGAVANLASDFDTRVSHAIATGELQPGQIPQSNAYILPGKTPGDNILMLARGEASAKDVAHDWLEGFARARYLSNRTYWQQALDALDTDLRSSGIISKSLFSKPQADRTDLEYIEVFSHLAEMDFLANHDAVTLSDSSHGILDEVLDDLGAVQGGLELASALSQYLTSDAAKNAVGAALDPLRSILRDAGAALTDLLAAAEASSPKSAADFIIASQQNIDEDVRIRLADLAKAADSPPTTKTDTPKPTDTALPPEATDGLNVTVADLAKLNGLHADGTRPAPIGATYSRIDPKKNGLSLIGGIAHGLPDGSISGSAKLANITIHPTIRSIDPARLRTNADEKEVILFRKKDGTLQAIGGLSFLQHATTCGVENVPVRVFPSGKKYNPQWAAKTAAESLIRANLATTAQTLSYLTKHALTRDAARRSNLIPKDTNGQELPTSRAAWLLHQHATKKTIADTISGRISTAAALSTIQDKAAALLKAAQQPSLPGFETSSFSVTSKQAQSAFNKDGILEADNAIITKPGASFSITAYHASPHNFRKFSTEFMGSGEGAQAYGWGLYFATSLDINIWYFTNFLRSMGDDWSRLYQDYINQTSEDILRYRDYSKDSFISALQEEFNEIKREYDGLSNVLNDAIAGQATAKTKLAEILAKKPKTKLGKALWLKASVAKNLVSEIKKGKSDIAEIRKLVEPIKEKLDIVEDFLTKAKIDKPTNYRVELNVDDSNLLMWDSEVNDELKAMFADNFLRLNESKNLEQLFKEYNKFDGQNEYDILDAVISFLPDNFSASSQVSREDLVAAKEAIVKERKKQDSLQFKNEPEEKYWSDTLDATIIFIDYLITTPNVGYKMYKALEHKLGSPKAASEWLAAHGYKGIKYLDGNSRSEGEGTYNYVIFDGNDIKITAVNETGIWSMTEGWQPYTDTTASFSLTAKQAAYTPEMLAIKEAAKKDGTFMKAPNGKPSNLNELQWLQVRTTAFKNWFGDWENDPANASKVVDENGEPLVVYHGTPTGGFTVFRDESYFSPHQWYAERYQHPSASSNRSSRDVGVPMMYEVFLNIRKPFDTRNTAESEIFESEFFRKWGNGAPLSERGLPDWTDATDLLEFIEENEYNYDGLILDEGGTPDGKGGVTLRGHSFVPVTPNQIKSATSNRGTFDANNPDITFSITAAKPRRKYMPLSEAVKLEQYIAMESYARKLYRDAISLAQANPKNKLDDAVRAAMHLRALLNAVFSTLPKEAQPWKALGHARKQIDSLTWAVSHSYANLDPHQAPGISPAEIEKYNESGYRDRRQWLANKLSRLIVSVADSSARAIEAHACRTLLDTAEGTVKTLLPKYQKSGKERRGTTAADVFNKALEFYNMFDWGVDKRAQELTAVSDTLNRQDLTEAERTEAEKRRQAILTFAGLRRESLPRVKTGVETLLAYIQTGRLAWEQKLLEERRATEAIQEAIAALEPRIEHSTTTAKEDQKRGWFANFFTSLQNPIQTLNQLANLPGKVGAIFADIRTRLAMAEDAKTYAVQQAHQDAAAALDAILGCTGEPSISRQIKRATFLSDANERINTGIRKPGRIKITTFQFTQQDIINLQQIRKEKGEEAFRLAIDTHRRKYSKEDKLANTIPYEEVFQDALAQMQDPSYRGGTIYVERYGERDIAHEDTLILTRLQAANLWLLAQQPSYANKYDQDGNLIERGMLDILGYTEKVIADLEAFIGPELRAYAIWKREYLNTTGLFEAYEQHMGLPFPKEENYWPGAFDNASNNAGLDALQTSYAGNGVYNMLIIRKKHLSEPNLSVDMEAAWEHAIQQHYHYIHLSPLTRQLRAITRDSDTRQRLRKIVGNATLDNLETQVNTLDGAPAQQLQAGAHANHLLGRWLRAFAKALLNMATGTTVKQVSAAAHALAHPGINLLNILPKLIKATLSDITGITLTPGHKTPREIRQLKAFRVRFNREDLSTIASGLTPGETISKLAIVDLFGSRFLEYTDAWSNSQAMAAVYNTEYDRAKAIMLTANEGKPLTPEQQQQLEEHCEKTVAVILKQTAQPLEREDKAALVQQRNWAASQNFFMMGEIISKLGCTVSLIKAGFAKAYGLPPEKASKLRRKAWLKGLTFYSGMGMASQAVLAALSYAIGSAPDSDDEDFLDWVIGNIVAGAMGFSYLNALPVIGESVAAIAQAATGKHGVFATYATTGVGITYKDMQDLFKILNPDKTTEERIYAGSNWLRLLTTLTGGLAVSKGATFVSELFSAANNINNAVRPALQRAKNTAKKEQKDRKALNRLQKQIQKTRYTKNIHKPS